MAIEGIGSEFEGTLDYVESRWRDADRQTLRHGFALLARGRPVSPEILAERVGMSLATAEAAMPCRRWSIGRSRSSPWTR